MAAEHFLSSTFRLSPRRGLFLLFFFFLSLLAAIIEDAPITDLRLYQCNEERATHVEVNETVWSSFLNTDDHCACDEEIAIRCFHLLGGEGGKGREDEVVFYTVRAIERSSSSARPGHCILFNAARKKSGANRDDLIDLIIHIEKGEKRLLPLSCTLCSCAVLANE